MERILQYDNFALVLTSTELAQLLVYWLNAVALPEGMRRNFFDEKVLFRVDRFE